MAGWVKRRLQNGWAADILFATGVSVLLALLGPFGNFVNGPFLERLPYWLVAGWCGLLIYGVGLRWIAARRWSRARSWLAIVTLVLAASLPLSTGTYLAAHLLWPELGGANGPAPFAWYLEVLVVTAPQVAAFQFVHGRRSPPAPRPVPAPDALLGAPARDIVCLSMEDHYVRVHTPSGSRLVLATLAQAMSALRGAPGLQTHRSWWVAEGAVEQVVREGRNLRLRLSNGVVAPVSRTAVSAVRAAGWLARDSEPPPP